MPGPMKKTRELEFPLIVRLPTPGPVMVRFLAMGISPLVRVMVPVTLKLIESPWLAMAIVSRREPAPLSFRLVTVNSGCVIDADAVARFVPLAVIELIPFFEEAVALVQSTVSARPTMAKRTTAMR